VPARLVLKVVTLLVLVVCTAIGARSCGSSGSRSDLNPSNVVGNGLAGVCANQQAVDASGGDGYVGSTLGQSALGQSALSQSALSQSAEAELNSALGMLGQKPRELSCPPPTTSGS
jgi:hypothetical protein